METTLPAPEQVMLNNLLIDKKMQHYRDSKELQNFWDVFDDYASVERIERELSENAGKYY